MPPQSPPKDSAPPWSALLPGRARLPAPFVDRTASDGHARYRAQRLFGSLDGLRAVSILAVIWHHTAAAAHAGGIWTQGNKGVTLFFVISGFLIVTLLLRTKDKHGAIAVGRFWGRRMCRIFPIYYVVLALYVIGVVVLEYDPAMRTAFFANLPAFATFTSNWLVNLDAPRVIFFFAWSLAAEEQFYLVWPWIERVCTSTRAVLVAGAALAVTQLVSFVTGTATAAPLWSRIVTSIPAGILLGVMLAHALHSARGFRLAWACCGRWWSAPVFAVGVLLALSVAPLLGENLGGLLAAVAMVPFVGSCVIREDNGLAVWLQLRPLAWIGTVSYGMYLLHMLSVNGVKAVAAWVGITSPHLTFVLGALVAVGLASASYCSLEKFFLRRKDVWFGETSAAVPAAGRRGQAIRPRFRLPSIGRLLP
jgi:peptidoglycan/LPS O-acetylase OafA/YrhL